jgi:hypothetical protein
MLLREAKSRRNGNFLLKAISLSASNYIRLFRKNYILLALSLQGVELGWVVLQDNFHGGACRFDSTRSIYTSHIACAQQIHHYFHNNPKLKATAASFNTAEVHGESCLTEYV